MVIDLATQIKGEIKQLLADNGELQAQVDELERYEADMDALLFRLTNGKFSKSRSYSIDFMESCVNEEFEAACNSCAEVIDLRERVDELTAECDALTAECDALADDLRDFNREREEYRELLSKAITQAAEIVNLQP